MALIYYPIFHAHTVVWKIHALNFNTAVIVMLQSSADRKILGMVFMAYLKIGERWCSGIFR